MLQKTWSHKPVRFVIVGLINTTIDFTILNILVVVCHLPIILSNIISVSISVSISYFLNNYIVFQGEHKISLKTYIKFFVVTGLSVIVVQGFLIYFLDTPAKNGINNLGHYFNGATGRFLLLHHKQLALNCAKTVAVVGGLFWNYILYTKAVFKHKTEEEATEELIT
ncbi:MAG TPA: GtrA family protein [Candidatus Saccharimonadales bacterium]|jgi:putative flippase GtrA|nr:GtrA family protein [Candidatus Saccharimonadales bacterium]